MGNKKDSLGDRMKRYENVPKVRLVRRMPVIIRLDGKAFHTFTRGFVKPFDSLLMRTMNDTMKYLCENIQGCVMAYTQSDEITLVLVDYQTLTSDAWFDNNVEKMCSIAASMATVAFNRSFNNAIQNWYMKCLEYRVIPEKFDLSQGDMYRTPEGSVMSYNDISNLFDCYKKANDRGALFDARAFNVPKEEVMNCLIWRQQDATRNSIQSAGQAQFSHKQLMGKSCNEIQDMLFTKKGINWNDYPTFCKRGTCCIKKPMTFKARDSSGKVTGICCRDKWVIDTEIPIFNREPNYINSRIFVGD